MAAIGTPITVPPVPDVVDQTHGLTLTPTFQPYTDDNTDGFRMTITASDATAMSAAVFRYRALPLQPGADEAVAVFDGVCSPADLEEFPLDEPLENADPPWFRRSVVDLVFRSRTELDEAWELIRNEVDALIDTLRIMDQQEEAEAVRLGVSS